AGVGIDLASSATYYFFNNAWRKFGQPNGSNFNDVVILPDQYVIGRQNNNADTSTMIAPGLVLTNKTRSPGYANAASGSLVKQDNYLTVYRPAVQSLDDSGLSNVMVASTIAIQKDQILVFDNTAQAKNKSASATYYFFNNAWRKFGQPNTLN